jgi:hypothetical protein
VAEERPNLLDIQSESVEMDVLHEKDRLLHHKQVVQDNIHTFYELLLGMNQMAELVVKQLHESFGFVWVLPYIIQNIVVKEGIISFHPLLWGH